MNSVVFSAQYHIISSSDDRTVKIWDLRNMRSPIASSRFESGVNKVHASARNSLMAIPVDSRHVYIHDLQGNRIGRLHRGNVSAFRNGLSVVSGSVALGPGHGHGLGGRQRRQQPDHGRHRPQGVRLARERQPGLRIEFNFILPLPKPICHALHTVQKLRETSHSTIPIGIQCATKLVRSNPFFHNYIFDVSPLIVVNKPSS